jgi:hypothetical protein
MLRGWEIEIEFDHIDPELLHLFMSCQRRWPHQGLCVDHHVILGEN